MNPLLLLQFPFHFLTYVNWFFIDWERIIGNYRVACVAAALQYALPFLIIAPLTACVVIFTICLVIELNMLGMLIAYAAIHWFGLDSAQIKWLARHLVIIDNVTQLAVNFTVLQMM